MAAVPDLGVFILTHGRADRVVTYEKLRRSGYTGPIVVVVDDEDKQAADYVRRYGSQVVIFSKADADAMSDSGDNFPGRRAILYARNYSQKIAAEMGFRWMWQLDDDYENFNYATDNDLKFMTEVKLIRSLDDVLAAMIEFAQASNADCVAIAQNGDFLGGEESSMVKRIQAGHFSRKAMNSFLIKTDRYVPFLGRLNEDVNTYTSLGRAGRLFITVPRLRLKQKVTQSNAGGLTETYLDTGTYVKSFYTVMYAPSCANIVEMGATSETRRIHHQVSWRHAVPQILDPSLRRETP